MEQELLTKIIAENLIKYRKKVGLTQLEVAEKLNYSDKSVSKWEQGNGMPDIFVLRQLAELYGVTVNDFLSEGKQEIVVVPKESEDKVNHLVIMLMSVGLCWLVAVFVYVCLALFDLEKDFAWFPFVYAVPISCIVLVILASLWKFRLLTVLASSGIVWTVLLAIYLTVNSLLRASASLFFIGIPLQALLLLWFYFRYRQRKKKNKQK